MNVMETYCVKSYRSRHQNDVIVKVVLLSLLFFFEKIQHYNFEQKFSYCLGIIAKFRSSYLAYEITRKPENHRFSYDFTENRS